ncbi:Adenylate cyclase class IV, CYTH domain [Bacillus wiedmannii]|uniref:Adenylate cyclase class IV, CYTH domain n=1 Tax=Bacillus wiedmannii TaxID=1890302 RepID=A0A1D3NSV1_9BACI|nr:MULTISPECIES: hypothetical protein [Bacillus]OAK46354.1 hypothetical protein A6285_18270 [Bacillus wiedmannii]OJD55117.1 hypothetical protein BAU22_27515 [Bacillus sp. 4048]TCD35014.1 hypothetical protein E0D84_00695 [Bacillus wiedmannii]SCN01348.1 Adenylate cyclase class 2 (Thermophilic) [Bacillus wiedmannii]SDD95139.1 Adenylate cyclase class IV, CYTH domain [Bacillus wiedmannii]
MEELEREIKILNIDVELFKKKMSDIGAVFKSDNIQEIFVYDLMTIYSRFCDATNSISDENQYKVYKDKLRILFQELDILTSKEQKEKILEITGTSNLMDILKFGDSELFEILSNNNLNAIIRDFGVNTNKWIRLRRTGNVSTLTIKHIMDGGLERDEIAIQQVTEIEMEIPSIEVGNAILQQMGYAFRNFQEKRRISYIFGNLNIELDMWPMIPPYIEIEGNDKEEIIEMGKLLGYKTEDFLSCNTEEIFKRYGLDIYKYRELRLEDNKK